MEILLPYLYSILAVTLLMLSWALVQKLWKKEFAEYHKEDDVLAGRKSCGNCGCGSTCKKEID